MISFAGFDIGTRSRVSVAHGLRMDLYRESPTSPIKARFSGKSLMEITEAVEFARGCKIVVVERPDEQQGFQKFRSKALFGVHFAAGEMYGMLRGTFPEIEVVHLSPEFIRSRGCGWSNSKAKGKADAWVLDWWQNWQLPALGVGPVEAEQLLKPRQPLGNIDQRDAGLAAITASQLHRNRLLRIECGLEVVGDPDPDAQDALERDA